MKDVLIYSDRETVAHKLEGEIPDHHDYCFWTVNGTPRQTEAGQSILFCDDDRVHARGQILAVLEGEIQFEPLEAVDEELPAEPVTRGFKYVSTEKYRVIDMRLHLRRHGHRTDSGISDQ